MKKIVLVVVIFVMACIALVAFCPPPPCGWWGCPPPPPTPCWGCVKTPTQAPSNTPHPTRPPTEIPATITPYMDTPPSRPTPTYTAYPTDTPGPGETVTAVPTKRAPDPACEPSDTGRVVWELEMDNTSPLHFGYWGASGKIGVCKIETGSDWPSTDYLRIFCACTMPGFTWRTDRVMTWRVMVDCDGKQFLVNEAGQRGSPFGGWTFGEYCPLAGCD